MNTTTFTTGDVIRFESGTIYQVLGIESDGRLLARGLRGDQLFGSQRHLDAARCKLIRHAAAPEAAQPVQSVPEQHQPAAPLFTGQIPRVSSWEAISRAETTLHNALAAARLADTAKMAIDNIVAAVAAGARPDPADFTPIRNFVDHIDHLPKGTE
jgi:hypothetical protein